MKSKYFILPLILLLTLAMSCKDEDNSFFTNLKDTKWRVLSFQDANMQQTLAPSEYILEISENTYTISLDVNNCGGSYSSSTSDGAIDFTFPSCTEACCDSDFAIDMIEFMATKVVKYQHINTSLQLWDNQTEAVLVLTEKE